MVTAWNGIAITALAEAGAALGVHDWVSAAARCARFLLSEHVIDGRVRRASLNGVAGTSPGVLEDYAWLVTGLLALHQATGELSWLDEAQRLLDAAIQHFADPNIPGSWFDTADDAETLVTRPRDPIDGATPQAPPRSPKPCSPPRPPATPTAPSPTAHLPSKPSSAALSSWPAPLAPPVNGSRSPKPRSAAHSRSPSLSSPSHPATQANSSPPPEPQPRRLGSPRRRTELGTPAGRPPAVARPTSRLRLPRLGLRPPSDNHR